MIPVKPAQVIHINIGGTGSSARFSGGESYIERNGVKLIYATGGSYKDGAPPTPLNTWVDFSYGGGSSG